MKNKHGCYSIFKPQVFEIHNKQTQTLKTFLMNILNLGDLKFSNKNPNTVLKTVDYRVYHLSGTSNVLIL